MDQSIVLVPCSVMAPLTVPYLTWLPGRVVVAVRPPNIRCNTPCSPLGRRYETSHRDSLGCWARLLQWAQSEQKLHRNNCAASHKHPGRSGIVSNTFSRHRGSPGLSSHPKDPANCFPSASWVVCENVGATFWDVDGLQTLSSRTYTKINVEH